MNKLEKPSFSTKEVYMKCVSIVKKRSLRENLMTCLPFIEKQEKEYIKKAISKDFHKIKAITKIKELDGEEFKKNYTGRMVPKKAVGRIYYDSIKAIPKFGKCPFCNQRIVSTLDHFLPKTHYPLFSVTPINLVPACESCNRLKTDRTPDSIEEVIMHPYYDDVSKTNWLKAKIIEDINVPVSFYVDSQNQLEIVLEKRLQFQFRLLDLNTLYSSHAAQEIVMRQLTLKRVFDTQGNLGVSDTLKDWHESAVRCNRNSWKSVLYLALSKSKWFCSDYFKSLNIK